jgi:flagellar motor protein MotB
MQSARYQDLHSRYHALVKETGGSMPDQKGLVDFILDYHNVREYNERLQDEKDQLHSENTKLSAAEQHLREQLASMENRLHLVHRMVEHLKESIHSDVIATPAQVQQVEPVQPIQQVQQVQQKQEPIETIQTVSIQTNPATGGIVLEDTLLFSVGSASLSPEGKKLLRQVANRLNTNEYQGYAIRIEGHTDSTPVVKTKEINIDNWFLGAKRAHMVLRELLVSGITPERLSLASYGEHAPIAPSIAGGEGNPKNRRVELILIDVKSHE